MGTAIRSDGTRQVRLDAYERHMKYGPTRTYWNDFVFEGYVSHRTEAIGVLYMSGYPDEALGSRGVLPGTHFIMKPFTAEALLRKVREVLDSG